MTILPSSHLTGRKCEAHGVRRVVTTRGCTSKGASEMKKLGTAIWIAAGLMLVAAPAFPQNQGQGRAIVTVLPSHAGEAASSVSPQDVKIKVSGRPSSVTNVTALRGAGNPLELVVLIDGSARSSLGSQLGEISHFVQEMPSNARMAIAYMANGRAHLPHRQ